MSQESNSSESRVFFLGRSKMKSAQVVPRFNVTFLSRSWRVPLRAEEVQINHSEESEASVSRYTLRSKLVCFCAKRNVFKPPKGL